MDNMPKDAKICAILLSSSGINQCEPKIISALQEYLFSSYFAYYRKRF